MKDEKNAQMKKSALIFTSLLLFSAVSAQEVQNDNTTDSLSLELQEVTVKASAVIRKTDRSIYNVDQSVKERSATTLNLIQNLHIPQLTINEIMETVTSSLGTIELRVNGREISIDKLKSINPENVTKIEWIDNPGLKYGTDVAAVLNIIVKNPTSGGSFMASSREALNAGFNRSNATLTLNNGASQWNIGGIFYLTELEYYREYTDSYKLPNGTSLERQQQPSDSYIDQRIIKPSISYNYMKSDSINLYTELAFYDDLKDKVLYTGFLSNTLSRSDNTIKLTEGSSSPHRYRWLNIYWEQKLKNSQTLVFNTTIQYSDTRSDRIYKESDEATGEDLVDITNNIKSQSWYYRFQGNYIKDFDKAGQLTAGIRYNGSKIKSTYLNYDDQTIDQTTNKLYFFGEYMITVRKFTFTAGVGGTWTETYLKDEADRESHLYFTPRLTINWRASDKSRWTLSYSPGSVNTPSTTALSPITQSIDGIQVQRGNPDLKPYLFQVFRLMYNFSNNNNLNISTRGTFYHSSNPIQTYYTWEDDKILRTYSNAGFYNEFNGNISIGYQPLPDWINLSADISFVHSWNKGTGFRHKLNSWGQYINLSVFHWNWQLVFSLSNPCKDLWNETISKGEFFNSVSIGYKWKEWYFNLSMFMPFGRYSNSERVISELVKQNTINRTNTCHRMPLIGITYNINWGYQKRTVQRKISGGAESGGGATAAGR